MTPSNSWVYPHLHMAARRMTEMARLFRDRIPHSLPAAEVATTISGHQKFRCSIGRCVRWPESSCSRNPSDWAFLMKTGTARNYAAKRSKDHLLRFTRLYDQVRAEKIDAAFLANCEWRDNIFPRLDWRYYA